MMAAVPHVISGFGLRKFQADGFLLTRVYQKESLASKLASLACSTKKSSLQIPKYSNWPKCKFCRPQLAECKFLKIQTDWLNQTARAKALI